MNRKLVIAVTAILLAIAISGVVWSTRPAPTVTGTALPTFDYASGDSWAVSPATPPPAVWEAGWDIDVLLLAREAALVSDDRSPLEKRRDKAAEGLSDLAAAFDPIGPVYAPYLRAATAQVDMAAATLAYFEESNRGRAFVIVADAPLPRVVTEAIIADPLLRDRFAGILYFGDVENPQRFAEGIEAASVCSRRYKPEDGCVIDIELRRSGGKADFAGDGAIGGRLVSGLIPWLNTRASKLAEPLGDFEEVEIVDIRRPGETDEAFEAAED
ncbi:hypothetical protein [Hyphomonas sp.]|uniref:hypothetical protein n=1 Tax=Hyphomonas sp. TaxID=87 RepID=UPI0025B95834|nr:hypothetical protein [Hyphomonas sp.]MBI1400475.1 hypothetical protein [Hyphomonas sp.]